MAALRKRVYPDRAPNTVNVLYIKCPTCGPTKLKGVLLPDKGWLQCSECRLCVPNAPLVVKMLEAWIGTQKS